MCCGQRVVQKADAARTTSRVWEVRDSSGTVVDTKTSEIAAKLAAARITGGTVAERVTTS
jgi:hypothetical protein